MFSEISLLEEQSFYEISNKIYAVAYIKEKHKCDCS